MATRFDVIERLWKRFEFAPNENQYAAITHSDGPLFLPAGPGSGKTSVLLWRAANLVVSQNVDPAEIYLSTFTEKAALQLKEGLRTLLAAATEVTNKPYDISRMYVGTVHSLCQRMLVERDFQPNRARGRAPALLDELDQYLLVNQSITWGDLIKAANFSPEDANQNITEFFKERSASKHSATSCCIALFNRLSEECIEPRAVKTRDKQLSGLLKMYERYRELLASGSSPRTDFSLLQQEAYRLLESNTDSTRIFRHVIVDEYQDTNTVQERIFFRLAGGHKNICAVGDDDQALYRFRGATVENFVRFPDRCSKYLQKKPKEVPLDTNYRSRERIVKFYCEFINQCDWKEPGKRKSYRVESKKIKAHSSDEGPAVIASTAADPITVSAEIANLTKRLVDAKRVSDPNQIAFLYPSLKTEQVRRMMAALERVGLRVYAPRAGSFLDTPEATAILGVFAHIFGRPERGAYQGDYARYYNWLDSAEETAARIIANDRQLRRFTEDRAGEIARARADYERLVSFSQRRRWDLDNPYDPEKQQRALAGQAGISAEAQRRLNSKRFNYVVRKRIEDKNPLKLKYALKRASSIDWSLLDLFYQLTLFEHFAEMFDAAQRAEEPDEGPVCNLALLTQYVSRFMDQRAPLISGDLLHEDKLQRLFFGSYLYALHRRGESEYEDAEDPFPKGRIPFLTVHQAKGLEFPVVVLGNPRKQKRLQSVEEIVAGLIPPSPEKEPLHRMAEFDMMRMFYVALSRAKNLLVVANFKSRGNFINDEFAELVPKLPAVPDFKVSSVPRTKYEKTATPKIYSYTGDFLAYQRCARQYLMFRKFDFVPSRSQTMVFGSLVHRTLDDIHQHLISQGRAA